jgi:hypothetical protein
MNKSIYEIYDQLQKKKDSGAAMSGDERFRLEAVSELIIAESALKDAIKALKFYAKESNWTEAYYGEAIMKDGSDWDVAQDALKSLKETYPTLATIAQLDY